MPGQVHPAARAAVDARWQQVNGWLWVATWIRGLALLAALVFVLASYAADARMLVVVLAALVGAHVVAVWMVELDPIHQRTPSRWTVTSLGTGLLAGISAGLALVPAVRNLSVGVADAVVLPAGLVVAAAVGGATELAARRVTTPGLPELGGTELRLAAPTPPGPVVQLDWTPPGAAPMVSVAPAERSDDLAAVLRYRVWALTGRAPGDRPLGRPTPAAPDRGPAPPPLTAGTPSASAGRPLQVAAPPGPSAPV